MKDFIRVMKALSDPNRVKVVKMLQQREMCVCEMQEALGIAQPTVSKHLKILEEAGLVQSRKDGLWVCYRLSGDGSPYAASLLGNLRYWIETDPEIIALREYIPGLQRELIRKKEASPTEMRKENGIAAQDAATERKETRD
ncbi:MAG: winged helix-turn-helix transcriptional regulator [Syntrophobacterales bacterium]|nr:winged helix-turn-helix transcriptional regulator [Syntrophobacterales bacterium]